MPAATGLKYAYLAYFSKPAEDRQLYRLIRQRKVSSVLEIGVGSLQRALDLISVCQRYATGQQVRYAAVDWFEERGPGLPPLSLIDAHRSLNATGAKVRVSPGGPAAVEAVANALPNTDLILLSSSVDEASLAPSWFFFPRMCHAGTVILRTKPAESVGGGPAFQPVDLLEIERLCHAAEARRAA